MQRLSVIFLAALAAACSSSTGSTSSSAGAASSAASTTGATPGSGSGSSSGGGSGGAITGTTTGSGKLADGADCNANSACQSNVCGLNGAGHCCTARCTGGSGICQATECDTSGACDYGASGTACGSTCSDAGFTSEACDGAGNCAGTGTALCTGDFACADTATCKTTCAGDGDCVAGFYCHVGACVAQQTVGACSANDMCVSGLCGIGGSGHCCSMQCTGSDPVCEAPDCDSLTGACEYTDAGTACGAASESCSDETQLAPSTCDGKGSCPGSVTLCYPYACGAAACFATCGYGAECASVNFCDLATSACCPVLPSGGFLNVDAAAGSDATACCGVGINQPCASLTRAMQIIDEAGASDVVLKATVDGGGGEWPAAQEMYPVVLGWGVDLYAPGIDFSAGNDEAEVFDVKAYSARDTVGYASIAGADGNELQVGFGANPTEATGIQVETGNKLYLAGTQIMTGGLGGNPSNAMVVEPGGEVSFGKDRTGSYSGTVDIGDPSGFREGWNGIECVTSKGQGCTLEDVDIQESAIRIEGMAYSDLYLPSGSTVTFTHSPVIGLPPMQVGFGQCPSKVDLEYGGPNSGAIFLDGNASVTFSNGAVQCIAGAAFYLNDNPAGPPSLMLSNSTIQNSEYGIFAVYGSAAVSGTTFQYNYNGIVQTYSGDDASTIDLNGGDAGANTVICSSSDESAYGNATPGIGVLNGGGPPLDADNVTWDTAGPDSFDCSDTLSSCSCALASCTVTAGDDGMDVVVDQGSTVSTNNPSLTKLSCAIGH